MGTARSADLEPSLEVWVSWALRMVPGGWIAAGGSHAGSGPVSTVPLLLMLEPASASSKGVICTRLNWGHRLIRKAGGAWNQTPAACDIGGRLLQKPLPPLRAHTQANTYAPSVRSAHPARLPSAPAPARSQGPRPKLLSSRLKHRLPTTRPIAQR